MHVVRVLQTAVMSEPCRVHGNSLLLCVRTCFNIFLGSENAANQSAAKAALSRMINAIVCRMEGKKPTKYEFEDAIGDSHLAPPNGASLPYLLSPQSVSLLFPPPSAASQRLQLVRVLCVAVEEPPA